MILKPTVAEICDAKISCDLVPEEEESIKMTEVEVVEDVVYELPSVEPIIDNEIVYIASSIGTIKKASERIYIYDQFCNVPFHLAPILA